jgi:hypothetical protein
MLAAEGKTEEIIKGISGLQPATQELALLVPKSRPCNCADPSAILPIVEDSRQERGCLQYQFSQAQDDPRRIMIWEEVRDLFSWIAARRADGDSMSLTRLSRSTNGGRTLWVSCLRFRLTCYERTAHGVAFAARLDELIEGELSLKRFNVLDRFH